MISFQYAYAFTLTIYHSFGLSPQTENSSLSQILYSTDLLVYSVGLIFDIRALWRSAMSVSVKDHKWRLNPVWHRMLFYSCTHMATADVKGLNSIVSYIVKIVQEAKLSLGQPTVLSHSTFEGHVTSSVTWPFDSPYAMSYWWSVGTKPLSLTVSRYSTSNVTQWLTWPWYDF